MKSVRHGLVAILFSILVLPLSALAAPLSELIASGASITAGDKRFSNFSGSLVGMGNFFPNNLSQVEVFGLTANNGHGLQFSQEFLAQSQSGFNEGGLQLNVAFDVTVTDPPHRIRSVTLVLAGPTFGGPQISCIAASVAALTVGGCGSEDDPFDGTLTAFQPFSSNTPSVHISTEFTLATSPFDSGVSSNGFGVTFSQSVPEPSIVLLLAFGAVLVTAMAHKVRRA